MQVKRLIGAGLVVTGLLLGSVVGQEQKQPTPEEVARIRAAAPARPQVPPKTARKVLVFNRSWGYKHSAIPYGAVAFKVLGEKSRAYVPVLTDDLELFEPENLAQFDAIIFNNTNNEIFLPEDFDKLSPDEQAAARQRDARLKKTLVEFIKGGKGLAVFHAGVASFRKWPEYGNIIGARFDNHPWGPELAVTLKIEEPDHPVMAAFKGAETFTVQDEIYQLKDPYNRDKVRVLMSIDTSRTNMKVGGIHRKDGDFAMTYVKPYGKGRVFYCALGHQHESFWNPTLLRHWLDGIQFVLGDLPGDVMPRKAGQGGAASAQK